ncbi:bacterial methyltransferase [Thermobifida fusca YX]|uniref:Ribosomal RNA small subunit methyltransferase H n=2 Tax=Thermobifida fusca TaxID=2021 RepID=RSMH_THEFY|nr:MULTISPECIES: 16S rRNA (cytosine(1402)-N(4))-methyltransferase RsmH [Thermobifida]Q47QX7.1 RecName: Full=Ribosomal RNA small subunit methyltransferase H; AltName: Full=16S rRNA m(4)C1402 methyltransferase; AltName: Full=rRNA (cytosine-N(4)-)-methyltransferase RsmH [Thermobifida fusca YX]AAZ55140.1 bacterial methyltransferase [Thermobifida fusca YX]EOR71832.1 methyltransferase [Thermobifida fusca TM51]MBO2528786.1 ribosomal RNA small subunit methyltransferase H [Thermobifida sp.]MDD6792013.1
MTGDAPQSAPQHRGSPAPAHVPVMLERVVELLAPALQQPGAIAVDGTLGLGGHAEALLRAHPGLRLVGVDRDTTALERARQRLAPYADRIDLVHAVYSDIPRILDELGIDRVHGLLFDLGVSSPQLDEAERGFAYSYDAPLDMRMDRTQERTAADIVNTYPASELTRIFRVYGEERFAARIAQAIVRQRAKEPVRTTGVLADLVRSAIPAAARRSGGHPAKRAFQALRIEVNSELSILERALPAALSRLAVAGRIVVLSYHSLEDRITKRVLTELSTDSTPPGLPVPLPDRQPELRLLTRGAELPTEQETAANPRAASARLRAAERTREP